VQKAVFFSVASLNLNIHISQGSPPASSLGKSLQAEQINDLALPSNLAIESGSPVTVAGLSGDFGKQHHL